MSNTERSSAAKALQSEDLDGFGTLQQQAAVHHSLSLLSWYACRYVTRINAQLLLHLRIDMRRISCFGIGSLASSIVDFGMAAITLCCTTCERTDIPDHT